MGKTKDELKSMFATGKMPTGADFAELIDGVEGPRGATGATGTAGKDGFGTKDEYDAIIARLDALEATP